MEIYKDDYMEEETIFGNETYAELIASSRQYSIIYPFLNNLVALIESQSDINQIIEQFTHLDEFFKPIPTTSLYELVKEIGDFDIPHFVALVYDQPISGFENESCEICSRILYSLSKGNHLIIERYFDPHFVSYLLDVLNRKISHDTCHFLLITFSNLEITTSYPFDQDIFNLIFDFSILSDPLARDCLKLLDVFITYHFQDIPPTFIRPIISFLKPFLLNPTIASKNIEDSKDDIDIFDAQNLPSFFPQEGFNYLSETPQNLQDFDNNLQEDPLNMQYFDNNQQEDPQNMQYFDNNQQEDPQNMQYFDNIQQEDSINMEDFNNNQQEYPQNMEDTANIQQENPDATVPIIIEEFTFPLHGPYHRSLKCLFHLLHQREYLQKIISAEFMVRIFNSYPGDIKASRVLFPLILCIGDRYLWAFQNITIDEIALTEYDEYALSFASTIIQIIQKYRSPELLTTMYERFFFSYLLQIGNGASFSAKELAANAFSMSISNEMSPDILRSLLQDGLIHILAPFSDSNEIISALELICQFLRTCEPNFAKLIYSEMKKLQVFETIKLMDNSESQQFVFSFLDAKSALKEYIIESEYNYDQDVSFYQN